MLYTYSVHLFGLVFFLAGFIPFLLVIGIDLLKRRYCTEIVVVEIAYTNNIDPELPATKTFNYTYNGENYSVSPTIITRYPSDNELFTGKVDPNNPKNIAIPLNYSSTIMFGIFCFIFTAIGAFVFLGAVLGYLTV